MLMPLEVSRDGPYDRKLWLLREDEEDLARTIAKIIKKIGYENSKSALCSEIDIAIQWINDGEIRECCSIIRKTKRHSASEAASQVNLKSGNFIDLLENEGNPTVEV